MNRINFLQQALEINQTQATIINKMIQDVPNDKLLDFIVFRTNYIEPMQSKELITKNALFDFRKNQHMENIRIGRMKLESLNQLKDFCQTYFKNKNLCYGPASFYDYVIISIDKDGNLFNNFNLKRLDSADESKVYNWLFENQNRIGVIEQIEYYDEPMKLESKRFEDEIKSDEVKQLMNKTKRINNESTNAPRKKRV